MVSVKNPNFVPNETIVDLKPVDSGATPDKAAPKTPIAKPTPDVQLTGQKKPSLESAKKLINASVAEVKTTEIGKLEARMRAQGLPERQIEQAVEYAKKKRPDDIAALHRSPRKPVADTQKPTEPPKTPPVPTTETPRPKTQPPPIPTAHTQKPTEPPKTPPVLTTETPRPKTQPPPIPTAHTQKPTKPPSPPVVKKEPPPNSKDPELQKAIAEYKKVETELQKTKGTAAYQEVRTRHDAAYARVLELTPGKNGTSIPARDLEKLHYDQGRLQVRPQQTKASPVVDHGAQTQIRPAVNPGTVQARRQRVQIDPIAIAAVRQTQIQTRAQAPTRMMPTVQAQVSAKQEPAAARPVVAEAPPVKANAVTILTPTVPDVAPPKVKVQSPTLVKSTPPSAPKGKGWFGKVFTVGVVVVGAGIAAYKAADGQGGRAALNNLKQLASVDTLVGLVPGGSVVMGAYRRHEATGSIGIWETAKDTAVEVASTVSAPVGIALTVGGLVEQATS